MGTIDTNKAYIIQGDFLQDLCTDIKTLGNKESIAVSSLPTFLEGIKGINPQAYFNQQNTLTNFPDQIADVQRMIEEYNTNDPDHWSEFTWEDSRDKDWRPFFIASEGNDFPNIINLFQNNRRLQYVYIGLPSQDSVENGMWDSTNGMFQGCSSLQYVDLPKTIINYHTHTMKNMFSGCRSLRIMPDISFNVCSDTKYMFHGCSSLYLDRVYDLGNVEDMNMMFAGCKPSNIATFTNLFAMCISADASSTTKTLIGNAAGSGLGLHKNSIKWIKNNYSDVPNYNDFINAGWSIE